MVIARITPVPTLVVCSFKANEIQRVFRGHLGRLYVQEKRKEKLEAQEMAYFTYLCMQLQKCFRGYYSRKYKHDQARRKQYCRMLAEQGELVRQNLQKYAEELAEVRNWLLLQSTCSPQILSLTSTVPLHAARGTREGKEEGGGIHAPGGEPAPPRQHDEDTGCLQAGSLLQHGKLPLF